MEDRIARRSTASPRPFRQAPHANRALEGALWYQWATSHPTPRMLWHTSHTDGAPKGGSPTAPETGFAYVAPPRPFQHTPHAGITTHSPRDEVRTASPRPFRQAPHANRAPERASPMAPLKGLHRWHH